MRRVPKEASPKESCRLANALLRTGLPKYVLPAWFVFCESIKANSPPARLPTEKGTLHYRTRGKSQAVPDHGNRLPEPARRKPPAKGIHPQPPIAASRAEQRPLLHFSPTLVAPEEASLDPRRSRADPRTRNAERKRLCSWQRSSASTTRDGGQRWTARRRQQQSPRCTRERWRIMERAHRQSAATIWRLPRSPPFRRRRRAFERCGRQVKNIGTEVAPALLVRRVHQRRAFLGRRVLGWAYPIGSSFLYVPPFSSSVTSMPKFFAIPQC